MTDIHCHALFGVDDGSDSRSLSVEMLKDSYEQGIRKVILTPHYRVGMFEYNREKIEAAFKELNNEAADIGIELYLGCEYHADGDIVRNIQRGRVHTLADTDYVLVEYKHSSSYQNIRAVLHELQYVGYMPVIAHAERYGLFMKDPEVLRELRKMGIMIQINSGSLMGREGFNVKRLCKRMIKDHLVDIIASDSHNMTDRKCCMKAAYGYVKKKYGEDRAKRLFVENPGRIFERP